MQPYIIVPKSNGRLELEKYPFIFSTSSNIIQSPVVGDKYYNPNTGKLSQLVGQTQYENLTVTGVLSKPHFMILRTLYNSEEAKNGSLSATHEIGEVLTILVEVRLLRLEYGSFDKTSNSPAEISLELSFTDTRVS